MPTELYNVVFAGELVDQVKPETARRKLMALFRLDEARGEQLFSGRRVFIKRNLDLDTAARLQHAFRQAGGRVLIEPVDAVVDGPDPDSEAISGADSDRSELTLAPVGAPLEQIVDPAPVRFPNTSALSLVDEQDWTLADCELPSMPQPDFDLDYLELVPMAVPAKGPSGQELT